MARYLLDTDWVIHYLNQQPDIVQRIDACRADGVVVSITTVAELYEGVYGSTDVVEGGQAGIAGARAIAPGLLEGFQERADEGRVDPQR